MSTSSWKRLAHQAFQLAQAQDVLSWQKMFEALLTQNSVRAQALFQRTETLLQEILEQSHHQFTPEFIAFIHLVIQKQCAKQISSIYRLFSQLLFLCKYSLVVTIETAYQLKKVLKADIEAKIMSHYRISNLLVKYKVIKKLLGGIRICTPLGVMDHSIKYKLRMANLEDTE